jgi:uncharacterized SAM-binding protein YcdF (DUF218 family)
MIALRELIIEVFSPYSVALIFVLAGLGCLWFSRKQLLGKLLISFGAFLLLFFGEGLLWQSVLPPLQGRYDALENGAQLTTNRPDGPIKWIVVLSGGYRDEQHLPFPDRLGHETLFRLTEGIALHGKFPESKLLLSGGPVTAEVPEAELMKGAAESLGLDSKDITLETESRDTESQARLIHPIVGNDPFILVTSGFHMPRSMALFRREGLDPIPAPTGLPLRGMERFALPNMYPEAVQLVEAQNNIREYIGFLWLKLWGRL